MWLAAITACCSPSASHSNHLPLQHRLHQKQLLIRHQHRAYNHAILPYRKSTMLSWITCYMMWQDVISCYNNVLQSICFTVFIKSSCWLGINIRHIIMQEINNAQLDKLLWCGTDLETFTQALGSVSASCCHMTRRIVCPSSTMRGYHKPFSQLHQNTGKFNFDAVKSLWSYPLSPPIFHQQPPRMDHCFATPLFVWMPQKGFKSVFAMSWAELHKQAYLSWSVSWLILGLDSYYNLASEYLECSRCKKYISWDEYIFTQLDLVHQLHFPTMLTYQYGWDKQVV